MDDFNPYAPPKSLDLERDRLLEDPDLAWRDGKMLMVRKGAMLPDRCLKCNAPARGYRFSRSLSWHSPAWILVFLISPLLYVLVYFIVRWRGRVTVGLCPGHRKRRARAIAIGWLTAVAGLGSIIASALVPDRFTPITITAGLVLLLGGIIGGLVGSRVLVPRRIDKNFVWLGKVSPEYLAAFPVWHA
jgi:hypothetical protein